MNAWMKKGALALCSRGELGLILVDKPHFVYYGDGNFDEAWTGIHVSPEKFGEPWSSRTPTYVDDFEGVLKCATEWCKLRDEKDASY